MNIAIGILVLCIVPAIVSCIVHGLILRTNNKININQLIKTLSFYFAVHYGILAFVKILLGKRSLTLFESFSDVVLGTYVHYSFLLLAAMIIPCFLKLILQKRSVEDYIGFTDSVVVSMLLICHMLSLKMSNVLYFGILLIGCAGSAVMTFCYHGEVRYCSKKNIRKRAKQITPVIIFWIVTMILYPPNEMYLSNVDEMPILYRDMMKALFIGAIVCFALYLLLTLYYLTDRQFSLMYTIIFAITLAGYLQGTFLNGKMLLMDGAKQTWSIGAMFLNAVIWICILGAAVILRYTVHKNIDKIYTMICIYISLIQLITWGYLRITTDVEKGAEYVLSTQSRLELNPENNVLVFILDWYDEQIIDKILEEDENFLDPLQDFTHYQNTTSLYAFTDMSLPYLLTDVEWQFDMGYAQYCELAFDQGTLLQDISDQKYDIGIYTDALYVTDAVQDIVLNYTDEVEWQCDLAGIYDMMLKCSGYKSAPFILKNRYWYTTDEMDDLISSDEIHSCSNDIPFYESLINEGLCINNEESEYAGAFRFYHLCGAHAPYIMSEDCRPADSDMIAQSTGSMRIVYEYIRQLKELGLYDSATIIITADHGQNYMNGERLASAERLGLERTSNPILFVKKANQSNEDGMAVSSAPVSHSEMAASIMEAVCGDAHGYGLTFEEIPEDMDRERIMILRRHYDIPYTEFIIRGNVREWDNWTQMQ